MMLHSESEASSPRLCTATAYAHTQKEKRKSKVFVPIRGTWKPHKWLRFDGLAHFARE